MENNPRFESTRMFEESVQAKSTPPPPLPQDAKNECASHSYWRMIFRFEIARKAMTIATASGGFSLLNLVYEAHAPPPSTFSISLSSLTIDFCSYQIVRLHYQKDGGIKAISKRETFLVYTHILVRSSCTTMSGLCIALPTSTVCLKAKIILPV